MTPADRSALPLHGITVVSVEHAVAAPFASRQLADLGARVIKIERPGRGDFARHYDSTVHGESSHFVWLNRAKESVELDLKDPSDRADALRLIDSADVFLENLGPGAADRLGLSADVLRGRHEALVYASISGYGVGGPDDDKAAFDLLLQCESGVVSVTGTPETPAKVGIAVVDIAAGMYCFSSVLAALYRRERTGAGATISIPMLDSIAEWMGYPLYYTAHTGRPPERTGSRHATIAPYGPFACGDGEQVYFGVQNDDQWARLCTDVLRMPDGVADPRFGSNSARVDHRDQLAATIEQRTMTLTSGELIQRLQAARLPFARLRDVHGLLDHPQLAARQRWTDIGTPGGTIRALRPPIDIDGMDLVMGDVPRLGEHTAAIRAELARHTESGR